MSKDKLSSQEIVDLVAAKASVSKRAAEEFLKVMISTIEEALLAGDVVKIKNLGTFKLQWNEPRKSVNVQTGEDIILSGYHKVSFTPDAQLRDQVNEPFAHLEALQLDGEPVVQAVEHEPVLDPLRTLNEQAFEIKNILDEIKGLSSKSQDFVNEELDVEIEEQIEDEVPPQIQEIAEPIFEIEKNEEEIEEHKEEVTQTVLHSEPEVVEEVVFIEPEIEPIAETSPETETEIVLPLEVVKPKKRYGWIWVLIVLFLLGGVGVGFYYFYPPAKETANKIAERVSFADIHNTISAWFTPKPKKVAEPVTVVIPKDTTAMDTIAEDIAPIDSLQLLFDNPRVYTEYLGTERIHDGSRLTTMSKRYYGSKDFWVYIYEANRENISDPDHIPVGTIIKIPKLDSKLIDVSNERCIQKAKELHDIYVK